MRSLRTRLNLGLVIAALVMFSGMMLYAVYAVSRITEQQLITRLQHDRDSLLAALTRTGDGDWRLADQRVSLVYDQPFSGHYFVVRAPETTLRSSSLWDQSLPRRKVRLGGSVTTRVDGPRDQSLLVLYSTVEKRDARLTLAVAEDVSAIQADIRRFQWVLAGTGVVGLVIFLLVQRWLLGRGFGQLARVRRELAELDRGTLERIPTAGLDREITPLVNEINRLMTLMRERTQRSRYLLGNLAHALKGPLTLLFQAVDDPSLADRSRLKVQLREQAERIEAVIERELKRARLASPGAPGQRTPVRAVVTDLLDAMTRIHRARAIRAATGIDDRAVFRGDPEDLTELLGTLLDNAFKWARAAVAVRAETDGGLTLTVEDDGPGCPPEQLQQLTERGRRLDETRPGSGLGLAIARDIVTHYDGDLSFDTEGPLAGMRVRVHFPGMRPD